MNRPAYPSVSLHNVAQTIPADWTDDGEQLCRVPETVGASLNTDARHRVRHPTGCELRFVPTHEDATIEITLSAPERTQIRPFWGSFQPWKPIEIGPTPEPVSFSVPERLGQLDTTDRPGRFAPSVCRILFERTTPVAVHRVEGPCRPPSPDERPDLRYLAYGTSITEGAAASAPHRTYVSQLARQLGLDALNVGCSGSAYCDAAMADYIARRSDWDVATLAISVNMANGDWSLEQFEERAESFVTTIASARPQKPVLCVTLFPYFDELTETGDRQRVTDFRNAVRSIVTESSRGNLSVVRGGDLLTASGLTVDLLHPGDAGMESIAAGVAEHVRAVIECGVSDG